MLQEFYASVTRKFSRQLSEEQILLATRSLGRLPLVQVNVGMIFEAISLGWRFQLSFWDSLILQAALDSKTIALSEKGKLSFTGDLQAYEDFANHMSELGSRGYDQDNLTKVIGVFLKEREGLFASKDPKWRRFEACLRRIEND